MVVSLRRQLRQAQHHPVIQLYVGQRGLNRNALIGQAPCDGLLPLSRPGMEPE
jgi:hypothetical protein